MATTQTKTTTTRKEWAPNEKQKMFLETLEKLGEATFRVIKDYISKTYGETIATGSVNVLTTKQYVGTKECEFEVETTTTYHYPTGDITETKKSKKTEKVYYLIAEADRQTEASYIIAFAQTNATAKISKEDIPAEDDLTEDDLVDMEDQK